MLAKIYNAGLSPKLVSEKGGLQQILSEILKLKSSPKLRNFDYMYNSDNDSGLDNGSTFIIKRQLQILLFLNIS